MAIHLLNRRTLPISVSSLHWTESVPGIEYLATGQFCLYRVVRHKTGRYTVQYQTLGSGFGVILSVKGNRISTASFASLGRATRAAQDHWVAQISAFLALVTHQDA